MHWRHHAAILGVRSHDCLVRTCDLPLAHCWQLHLHVILCPPSEGAMRVWCNMNKVYWIGEQIALCSHDLLPCCTWTYNSSVSSKSGCNVFFTKPGSSCGVSRGRHGWVADTQWRRDHSSLSKKNDKIYMKYIKICLRAQHWFQAFHMSQEVLLNVHFKHFPQHLCHECFGQGRSGAIALSKYLANSNYYNRPDFVMYLHRLNVQYLFC